MKVRKFRLLRLKHGVQLRELSEATGLSSQRVSELELSEGGVTKAVEEKICKAFEEIASKRSREINFFEVDYLKNKSSLFELVEAHDEL